MLKSNKNDINYISKDEAEKLLEYQGQVFYSKFEEQKKAIDEIKNCISERFGEDVLSNGTIENIIKNILSNENNSKYNDIIDELTINFNKKMEESQKKHEKFIQGVASQSAKDLEKISNDFAKNIEKIFSDFNNIEKKVNLFNIDLKEKDKTINGLAECIQKSILKEQKHIEQIQNKFTETNKMIDKINVTGLTSRSEKKIKEQYENFTEKINDLKDSMKVANEEIKNDLESTKQLQYVLQSNFEEQKIQFEEELNINKKTLIEQCNKLKDDLDKSINNQSKQNDSLKEQKIKLEQKFGDYQNNFAQEFIKLKNDIETINNNQSELMLVFNNKQSELEKNMGEYQNILVQKYNKLKNDIDIVNNNQDGALLTFNEQKSQLQKSFTDYKNILKQQYDKIHDDNDEKINSINKKIEDLISFSNKNFENINKKVLKIKADTTNMLNEKNDVDIETLQNNYNSNFISINEQLEQLVEEIDKSQKTNKDNNSKLQIKIKAYIDKKIENINADNLKQINEIVDKINLSIAEKEEVEKLEMEQLLNKKLKAIEKENERIIKKQIESLSNSFSNQKQYNYFDIEEDKPIKSTRKRLFDILDEDDSDMLKQSADSVVNPIKPKNKKSEMLKLFFDEDEDDE